MRSDMMANEPPAPNPDNEALRARLAEDVAAFLAKGNRIKRIPKGVTAGTTKGQSPWSKRKGK